jgi:hypothetical protein
MDLPCHSGWTRCVSPWLQNTTSSAQRQSKVSIQNDMEGPWNFFFHRASKASLFTRSTELIPDRLYRLLSCLVRRAWEPDSKYSPYMSAVPYKRLNRMEGPWNFFFHRASKASLFTRSTELIPDSSSSIKQILSLYVSCSV